MISKLPIGYVEDVSALPAELVPIRVRDREPDGSSAAVSEPAGTDTITTMRRGVLRGRIEVTDEGLDVVVCHLKSKLLSYPGGRFQPHDEGERARYAGYALDKRAAEAVAVRTFANEILAGHGQDRALVVLGDLNDEAAASTTQILLGPPGSEIGTPGYEKHDKGDAWRLWNLAPRIQAAIGPETHNRAPFTRISSDQAELIDHILVSQTCTARRPVHGKPRGSSGGIGRWVPRLPPGHAGIRPRAAVRTPGAMSPAADVSLRS